ncbi:Glutathione S-transferase [Candidatus Rhodobacter oscarellae]|uniref:Glutathione S-transferase n=1 Tax=Candidatus Rhodobacter oscarellae TaxID=1675527 RepID=A0A0J9E5L5_9RHOB|nr:glutathione S-transferase [Candidatus Rhodobacter lobularis]KMW57976.1 Glutathione S-transferase [Candidatus Rhodobacter lobularis]
MTDILILGDRPYSSWSLRAWLLFEVFNLPRETKWVDLSDKEAGWGALAPYPTARTVPTMVSTEGAVISDSLAIAEELASRNPEAGLLPAGAKARATARTLAAEMHSGFFALRRGCAMNLLVAYADFAPADDVNADLARIDSIWSHALDAFGGPWLCGSYSIADAFFAPVAARIAGHGLEMSPAAASYVNRHLADPAFRRWRAMALASESNSQRYAKDNAQKPWPGPTPRAAEIAQGPSVNSACPYSGDPVTDFMALDGKVYGFCNPFCRDKTLADPEAWPSFMALLD